MFGGENLVENDLAVTLFSLLYTDAEVINTAKESFMVESKGMYISLARRKMLRVIFITFYWGMHVWFNYIAATSSLSRGLCCGLKCIIGKKLIRLGLFD